MEEKPSKRIIVLTANVKYPSSDSYYLTSNSYVIRNGSGDSEDLEKSFEDFKKTVEVDGFKIVNLIAYSLPPERVKEL